MTRGKPQVSWRISRRASPFLGSIPPSFKARFSNPRSGRRASTTDCAAAALACRPKRRGRMSGPWRNYGAWRTFGRLGFFQRSVQILETNTVACLDAGASFGDAIEKPWVVLQTVVEPIILAGEANENP